VRASLAQGQRRRKNETTLPSEEKREVKSKKQGSLLFLGKDPCFPLIKQREQVTLMRGDKP
jgi:hypothetical protein